MKNKDTELQEKPVVTEPEFLNQYRACYPGVKKFHVTSDNLVFLDKDYQNAVSYQAQVGKGELKTY